MFVNLAIVTHAGRLYKRPARITRILLFLLQPGTRRPLPGTGFRVWCDMTGMLKTPGVECLRGQAPRPGRERVGRSGEADLPLRPDGETTFSSGGTRPTFDLLREDADPLFSLCSFFLCVPLCNV